MSSGASERIAWAREKSAFQVQLDESSQVAEDATAKLIEERTQHAEALAEADRRRETELADMRKKSLERDAQLLGDILHPTSYILHPTSYILHLTSYILHLTSYTFGSKESNSLAFLPVKWQWVSASLSAVLVGRPSAALRVSIRRMGRRAGRIGRGSRHTAARL